jgi:hypothetical protein
MDYTKEGVTGRKRRAEHPSIRELRENHRIGKAILTNNETAAIVEALTILEDRLSLIPFPVGFVVALVPVEAIHEVQTIADRSQLGRTAKARPALHGNGR